MFADVKGGKKEIEVGNEEGWGWRVVPMRGCGVEWKAGLREMSDAR